MQYTQFRDLCKGFTAFSLNEIRAADPRFHRRRLTEWQHKGYIRKLIRGYYILGDLELTEKTLYAIANRIYRPSYVSLETALFQHGLIPEAVYGVTSISTRRTYRFETPIATFSYHTLRPRLFWGYEAIRFEAGRTYKLATAEKALLDLLYLKSDLKGMADFESLRINAEVFVQKVQADRLQALCERFGNKALDGRVQSFLEFISNA